MTPDWTAEQVAAHNARVAAGKVKHGRPFMPTDYKKLPPLITAVSMLAEIAPSTDEQKLNRTERAYLAYLRARGLSWIGVQNITLKLADDCRLTCDFCYINSEGRLTLVDTKGGFWREDAKIKIKVAARQFPFITFIVAHKEKTQWREEVIKP